MTAPHHHVEADQTALRRELSRVLRPFVDGTAMGMSSWVMTESRVAVTARDAARAILPLLGTPARSAHRVRGLIVPALTCSWTELDGVFEDALTKLLALPPAVPGVVDPPWDRDVPEPRASRHDWNVHGSSWTPSAREGDTVTGPSGTVGRLLRSDRRHALIVADGRSVRTRARCDCSPKQRRERGEVAFELVTFGRAHAILEVSVGTVCTLCRAPVA
ncbi:MAG: hypothetical protein JWL95_1784 [Gemmatimonadetes bacterium]|nr:hypothetical protein [Gemmatimonadota bacterium]